MRSFCVIFDMDGVLVDSLEAHFAAFQKMGEVLGVPFTRELLGRTVGMHNNEIFPLWLGKAIAAAEVAELAARKERLYRELAAGRLKEIPGAVALVRELVGAGIPIAVGSSGPRENVDLAVRTLGIREHFAGLVTGDDVSRGKPDPEIFLKAAALMKAAPSECVVIEDAPQGIEAALAARMRVAAVTTSRERAALSRAHLVLDSMTEFSSKRLASLF